MDAIITPVLLAGLRVELASVHDPGYIELLGDGGVRFALPFFHFATSQWGSRSVAVVDGEVQKIDARSEESS
ncbi:MAG: hypothetical protein ACRD4R_15795 [Candidatus Acidiferrales bacterium]